MKLEEHDRPKSSQCFNTSPKCFQKPPNFNNSPLKEIVFCGLQQFMCIIQFTATFTLAERHIFPHTKLNKNPQSNNVLESHQMLTRKKYQKRKIEKTSKDQEINGERNEEKSRETKIYAIRESSKTLLKS